MCSRIARRYESVFFFFFFFGIARQRTQVTNQNLSFWRNSPKRHWYPTSSLVSSSNKTGLHQRKLFDSCLALSRFPKALHFVISFFFLFILLDILFKFSFDIGRRARKRFLVLQIGAKSTLQFVTLGFL